MSLQTDPRVYAETAAWMLETGEFYPHEVPQPVESAMMFPQLLAKGWLTYSQGELGYRWAVTSDGFEARLGLLT